MYSDKSLSRKKRVSTIDATLLYKKSGADYRSRFAENKLLQVYLAYKMLLSLALDVGSLVPVDDVVFAAFVYCRGKLGEAFLSCIFITSFSSGDSLPAKCLHAAGESLVAGSASLVLTNALKC